ncbi:hypothetical protein D9758_010879 [Tetrapyrgos nigripes]|uniref:Uncharacterized protein n=1 Tax=Tetrapyrgos nigripes TaxID=182062 RepID=A0A8H5GIQ7_9AGAR|nr:hypothetical protein D9758_010879 [Tetrapyrgos nigripes]
MDFLSVLSSITCLSTSTNTLPAPRKDHDLIQDCARSLIVHIGVYPVEIRLRPIIKKVLDYIPGNYGYVGSPDNLTALYRHDSVIVPTTVVCPKRKLKNDLEVTGRFEEGVEEAFRFSDWFRDEGEEGIKREVITW